MDMLGIIKKVGVSPVVYLRRKIWNPINNTRLGDKYNDEDKQILIALDKTYRDTFHESPSIRTCFSIKTTNNKPFICRETIKTWCRDHDLGHYFIRDNICDAKAFSIINQPFQKIQEYIHETIEGLNNNREKENQPFNIVFYELYFQLQNLIKRNYRFDDRDAIEDIEKNIQNIDTFLCKIMRIFKDSDYKKHISHIREEFNNIQKNIKDIKKIEKNLRLPPEEYIKKAKETIIYGIISPTKDRFDPLSFPNHQKYSLTLSSTSHLTTIKKYKELVSELSTENKLEAELQFIKNTCRKITKEIEQEIENQNQEKQESRWLKKIFLFLKKLIKKKKIFILTQDEMNPSLENQRKIAELAEEVSSIALQYIEILKEINDTPLQILIEKISHINTNMIEQSEKLNCQLKDESSPNSIIYYINLFTNDLIINLNSAVEGVLSYGYKSLIPPETVDFSYNVIGEKFLTYSPYQLKKIYFVDSEKQIFQASKLDIIKSTFQYLGNRKNAKEIHILFTNTYGEDKVIIFLINDTNTSMDLHSEDLKKKSPEGILVNTNTISNVGTSMVIKKKDKFLNTISKVGTSMVIKVKQEVCSATQQLEEVGRKQPKSIKN